MCVGLLLDHPVPKHELGGHVDALYASRRKRLPGVLTSEETLKFTGFAPSAHRLLLAPGRLVGAGLQGRGYQVPPWERQRARRSEVREEYLRHVPRHVSLPTFEV